MIKKRIGIPFGFWPLHIYEQCKNHARILAIVSSDAKAKELQHALAQTVSDHRIIYIPSWNCPPYDRKGPRKSILAAQNYALEFLSQPDKPEIVITSIRGAMQLYPPLSSGKNRVRTVFKNQDFPQNEWFSFLEEGGYLRVDTVRAEGEYALRGGIVDIFPLNGDWPLRIDLFDTQVEKIYLFDPHTQRRTEEITQADIPSGGSSLTGDQKEKAQQRFCAYFKDLGSNHSLYEAIGTHKPHPELAFLGEISHGTMHSLFAHARPSHIVMDGDLSKQNQDFYAEVSSHYEARLNAADAYVLPPEKIYIAPSLLQKELRAIPDIQILDSLLQGGKFDPSEPHSLVQAGYIRDVRHHVGDKTSDCTQTIKTLVGHVHKDKRILHLSISSPGNKQRLIDVLGVLGIHPKQGRGVRDFFTLPSQHNTVPAKPLVYLQPLPYLHGCVFESHVIVPDTDLLPVPTNVRKRSPDVDLFISEANALAAGDYIVHEDHGIGQFLGLEVLDILGAPHDCVVLTYQQGDKLFVPVENIDMLSRYGSQDASVVLDKLGHQTWQKRKEGVRKDLLAIARDLINVAASREETPAPAFPTVGLYNEVVARFTYTPTPDQEKAIADVEEDLSSGKLMDRLICGDVGFGKTEVAMRAAAQVAAHGAQVAVVVPTTLLARQHYAGFVARFEGLPLVIKQLSRFTKPSEVNAIKQGLRDGNVNIVIGTHGLLHQSVTFQNLGLLIVDEEQHFGVKQKESLKKIATDLHVLTLTATPIPRTLQMSLTGVRELSIIASPPIDRLPVYTQVSEDKTPVLTEALLREKSRQGLSFIVCPRLKDLDDMKERIVKIAPDLTLAVAHGQMHRNDLDTVMTDFADQKFDVLIATNIIESGLDIPIANTLIVHRADMFGLAQLYQLRGRVGRGNVRGYAYLTYPQHTILTQQARRRLEVLESLDQLGAGFQLASYDLDIRGCGNILGEQQSGHVREVGMEMYQQMLQEALAALKQNPQATHIPRGEYSQSPQINLGFPVLLPESYVSDLSTRLDLYRRSAQCTSPDALDDLRYEMIDRFGKLPEEAINFFEVLHVKIRCKALAIARVNVGDKGVVITFYPNGIENPDRLIAYIHQNNKTVKLHPDQKLVFIRLWKSASQQLQGLKEILNALQKVL
ncbi:MAG: transcription-repair coupling factor [Alphaproteobacteria bacterium]|nr:MAG: transcription-repair coupling factor [Alphaproteobacteria bacterium]